MGWSVYFEGVYLVFRRVFEYGRLFYVMENGIVMFDDEWRKEFII